MSAAVGTQIRLADGRMLGYVDDTDEPNGTPVLFFHGQPGNRLFRLPSVPGYRIITIDRPGYGLSDFQSNRRILDWPEDVLQLADALGLERFGIVGHSAGGPYAAACAYRLPADRLTGVVLVASMGPIGLEGISVPPLIRLNQRLRPIAPLWVGSFRLFWQISRRNPQAFVNAAFKQVHDSDRALESVIRPILQRTWEENLRVDSRGYIQEAALLLDPWGFDLKDIPIPVSIWHGTADTNAPVEWGRYLAHTIPKRTVHENPDEGHFAILFKHWVSILSAARGP